MTVSRTCQFKLLFMAIQPQTAAKIQLVSLHRNMQQLQWSKIHPAILHLQSSVFNWLGRYKNRITGTQTCRKRHLFLIRCCDALHHPSTDTHLTAYLIISTPEYIFAIILASTWQDRYLLLSLWTYALKNHSEPTVRFNNLGHKQIMSKWTLTSQNAHGWFF